MSEVVFDVGPSIGAAYQANIGEMTVSRKSVYNKLNGIEPRISAALVEESVTRFAPIIEKLGATLTVPIGSCELEVFVNSRVVRHNMGRAHSDDKQQDQQECSMQGNTLTSAR